MERNSRFRKNNIKIKSKNITSIALMLISLSVLIGFNVFWIFKNYQEQKTILLKELNNQFAQTMTAMQDSLIQSQLKVGLDFTKKDSLPRQITLKPIRRNSVKKIDFPTEVKQTLAFFSTDSLPKKRLDSTKISGISVIIKSSNSLPPDSLRELMSKLTTGISRREKSATITLQIQSDTIKHILIKKDTTKQSIKLNHVQKKTEKSREEPELKEIRSILSPKNFIFVLRNDSLKLSEIASKYRSAITKSKIILPFKIAKTKENADSSQVLGIRTENFKTGFPAMNYAAVFDEYKFYLLKKIFPEILFSIFLVVLTAFSFGLIYRNLQKQKRLTELKNDFISNVTHELKTPIATVSVAIEALSNFNVLQNPEQTKEYLNISKNELNRLSMLVDKVLKMSIFEQKELELKLEVFDFKQLLEGVLSTMKIQFEKFSAAVNYDCLGDDFMLKGDAVHLTNVVYNLLDNALKYSPEPQIEILLSADENEVKLSVKDNGFGIEEAYQHKVFEKFFRVPTGDIHTIKGYGLGLSYVAKVIEKHHGKIILNSKLNEGSEFIIRLLRGI